MGRPPSSNGRSRVRSALAAEACRCRVKSRKGSGRLGPPTDAASQAHSEASDTVSGLQRWYTAGALAEAGGRCMSAPMAAATKSTGASDKAHGAFGYALLCRIARRRSVSQSSG